MIENDPELATLMEDEEFEKQVAELTEEKIKELMTDKFNGEDDSFNMGVITEVVELGLESYKESLNELKVEYLEEKTE
jgi:arginyl-tRNA synthetase